MLEGTDPRIRRFNSGEPAEESRLYLLGNSQLRAARRSVSSLSDAHGAGFQAASHCRILPAQTNSRLCLEASEDPSPCWLLWWKQKAHSTFAPFFVLGVNVFGEKENPAIAANQLVVRRIGLGSDECQVRAAIRRGYLDPSFARLKAVIHHQLKSKLVDIELHAAFLIAYEHDDVVYAQIRFTKVKAQDGPVGP